QTGAFGILDAKSVPIGAETEREGLVDHFGFNRASDGTRFLSRVGKFEVVDYAEHLAVRGDAVGARKFRDGIPKVVSIVDGDQRPNPGGLAEEADGGFARLLNPGAFEWSESV